MMIPFALALASGIFALPAAAADAARPVGPGSSNAYETGEVLVRLKPSSSPTEIDRLNKQAGGKVVEEIEELGVYKIRASSNEPLAETVSRYAGDGAVESVQPNYEYELFAVPNDEYYPAQWNLQKIEADTVWNLVTGSSDVVIAVIDSGVDWGHPDLSANIWQNSGEISGNAQDDDNNGFVDDVRGWDFVNDDNNPTDDYVDDFGIPGHGTCTAGIIAADTDNTLGIAGISWNSRLMPVKCADSDGKLNDFDLSSSVVYAADNGAEVICMSLGGPGRSPVLSNAINYAYQKGCFMVAAVGNADSTEINYPAGYDHVTGVAASTETDGHAGFSNHNASCDVAAPGENIWATGVSGGDYEYLLEDGTSAAAPHAAGLAALLLSNDPYLSADDLAAIIDVTSDDLGAYGWDSYFGYGRINASAAFSPVSSYFAEGATLAGFEEYILLMNPGAQAAYVALNYLDRFGNVKSQTVHVPSQARRTVKVNDISPNSEVSTKNISGSTVLAERAMYFSYNGKAGGHDSIGVAYPSTEWYLAEGYTGGSFDTYVLIQNPNSRASNVTVTFMKNGGGTVERQYEIAGNSRFTIHVDEILPNDEVSTQIVTTNGVGVIAERSMYFNYNGKAGGHNSIGATYASADWYLAEGFTGGGFDTYVLIQNPNPVAANTQVTFMKEGGETLQRDYVIAANSRYTIRVDEILPNDAVSTKIDSDQEVIAERSMYFDYDGKAGGHDSVGAPSADTEWFLPEGYTGGDFDTWVLIQNPNPLPADVTMTFYTRDAAPRTQTLTLPANSRRTVELDQIEGLGAAEVSTRVTSNQPVIVERAMYFIYHGYDGGHASIGYATE